MGVHSASLWVYTEAMTDTPDQPAPRRGRPATGQTPKRYVRMGPLWDDAAALAHDQGETMTSLVERAIRREVERLRRLARTGGVA